MLSSCCNLYIYPGEMRIKGGERICAMLRNDQKCICWADSCSSWSLYLSFNLGCNCLLEYNRDYTTLMTLIKHIDECRRLHIICNISSEEYHRCCCCCDKYHEKICKIWLSCTIKLQDIVYRFSISQFLHPLPNVQGGTFLHSSKKPLIIPVSITYI